MRKIFLSAITIAVLLSLSVCNKDKGTGPSPQGDGIYAGTYFVNYQAGPPTAHRTHQYSMMLTLDKGTYTYEYTAASVICGGNGVYGETPPDVIEFKEGTLNFPTPCDASEALLGVFNFQVVGDSLFLERTNTVDTINYRLRLKKSG